MNNDSEHLKVKRNLTALVEFSRIINSSLDLNFILNNVLLTCMGKFLATKGAIALNINGSYTLKASKGIPEHILGSFPEIKTGEKFLVDENFKAFLVSGSLCIAEEMMASSESLGMICLGEKLNKAPYSDDDKEFLRTIINISATAIKNTIVVDELSKVNKILDSRVHRLNSLFDLSKEFGLFSESTKVAKLLVYSVIGQFLVSRFAVISFDGENIRLLESKYDEDDILKVLNKMDIKSIDEPLTKEMIKKDYEELAKMKIELVVPMQLQGETKGLILLGKRISKQDYSDADIEFIYSVGSLAIISLENRRLFKEALEKQKMEEELEIARDIQRNLLPHSIPQFSNFDIAAVNLSSKQVGGDYYDIITLDENTFCVTIADVSGKGVPAALLMANLQAFLKTTCKQGMKLDEATGLINDLISENTMDGKFITFFWGVVHNENKTITYVNAGHNPPLLIRNGKIIKLEKGGIILGVMKTFVPYVSEQIQLEKDDVIVLFTDGISEAKNIADEEFSDEKLETLALSLSIREDSAKPAGELLGSIQREVQAFAAGTIQSDDITLVILKVK
ncbi:MAG: GAF domain-containing SpoIIE family protein phosphatase [Ignavibacteriaceae bacterium]